MSNYSNLNKAYQDNTKNHLIKKNIENFSFDIQLPSNIVLPLLSIDLAISVASKSGKFVVGRILDIPIDTVTILIRTFQGDEILPLLLDKVSDADAGLKMIVRNLKKINISNIKTFTKLIQNSILNNVKSARKLLEVVAEKAAQSIDDAVLKNAKSGSELSDALKAQAPVIDDAIKAAKTASKATATFSKLASQTVGKAILKVKPDLLFSGISLGLDIADYAGADVGSVNYSSMLTNEALFALKDVFQTEFENSKKTTKFNNNIIGPLMRDDIDYFNLLLIMNIVDNNMKSQINTDINNFNNGGIKAQYIVESYDPDSEIFHANCINYKVKEYINSLNYNQPNELLQKTMNAFEQLCINNGGTMTDDKKCSYTEQNCVAGKAFDTNNKVNIYAEWKDNKCQIADPSMMLNCKKLGLKYDKDIQITNSTDECKTKGTCKTLSGFCKIDSDYCYKYKAQYEENPNISNTRDCNVSIGQQILEMLIGTVILRELMDVTGDAVLPVMLHVMENSHQFQTFQKGMDNIRTGNIDPKYLLDQVGQKCGWASSSDNFKRVFKQQIINTNWRQKAGFQQGDIKVTCEKDGCKDGFTYIPGNGNIPEKCVSNKKGQKCVNTNNKPFFASLIDDNGDCINSNSCVDGFSLKNDKCIFDNSGKPCNPNLNKLGCPGCEKPSKGDLNLGLNQVYDDEGYCTVPSTPLKCKDTSNTIRYTTDGKPYCDKMAKTLDDLGKINLNNPYKPLVDFSNLGELIAKPISLPVNTANIDSTTMPPIAIDLSKMDFSKIQMAAPKACTIL